MKRSAAGFLILTMFVSACSGGATETADPDTAAPEAPSTTTVAQTIEIDEIKNIAIFSGEARLQQHRDTITGDTIIYHM